MEMIMEHITVVDENGCVVSVKFVYVDVKKD